MVRNYPLPPLTAEEEAEHALVMQERKLCTQFDELTGKFYEQPAPAAVAAAAPPTASTPTPTAPAIKSKLETPRMQRRPSSATPSAAIGLLGPESSRARSPLSPEPPSRRGSLITPDHLAEDMERVAKQRKKKRKKSEQLSHPVLDRRFLGSLSYEHVDMDSCLLIDQLSITTRIQTRQQVVLLKVSI